MLSFDSSDMTAASLSNSNFMKAFNQYRSSEHNSKNENVYDAIPGYKLATSFQRKLDKIRP